MAPLIFTPRCHVCREPASVAEYGKYYCGDCYLAHTRQTLPAPPRERPAKSNIQNAEPQTSG